MGLKRNVTRLLTTSDIDEMRRVSLIDDGDGPALIVEQTDGELTYQMFGSVSQARMVRIESDALPDLCKAIGEGDDPCASLACFFEHDEVFLSDLLDLMDAAGIPYSFSSISPSETLTRMPEAPAAGYFD